MNINQALSVQNCNKNINYLINDVISKCPPALSLFNKVIEEGFFSIDCINQELVTSEAVTYHKRRQILVSDKIGNDLSKLTHVILFELHNLSQAKNAKKLNDNICLITPRAYADKVNYYEYKSAKGTHTIAQECVMKHGWDPQTDNFVGVFEHFIPGHNWKTYEGYVQSLKQQGIVDRYIKQWHSLCSSKAQPKLNSNEIN